MTFLSKAYISNALIKFKIETSPKSLKIFAFLVVFTGIILTICAAVSFWLSEGKFAEAEFRLKWNKNQNGYYWHVISAVFDWLQMIFYSAIAMCLCSRIKSFREWDKI